MTYIYTVEHLSYGAESIAHISEVFSVQDEMQARVVLVCRCGKMCPVLDM